MGVTKCLQVKICMFMLSNHTKHLVKSNWNLGAASRIWGGFSWTCNKSVVTCISREVFAIQPPSGYRPRKVLYCKYFPQIHVTTSTSPQPMLILCVLTSSLILIQPVRTAPGNLGTRTLPMAADDLCLANYNTWAIIASVLAQSSAGSLV